jgi:hypothetical protein
MFKEFAMLPCHKSWRLEGVASRISSQGFPVACKSSVDQIATERFEVIVRPCRREIPIPAVEYISSAQSKALSEICRLRVCGEISKLRVVRCAVMKCQIGGSNVSSMQQFWGRRAVGWLRAKLGSSCIHHTPLSCGSSLTCVGKSAQSPKHKSLLGWPNDLQAFLDTSDFFAKAAP